MSTSTFISTQDGCRQNMYATEPRLQPVENYSSYSFDAEKINGRWAMIGFVFAIGAYALTGQILPGVF